MKVEDLLYSSGCEDLSFLGWLILDDLDHEDGGSKVLGSIGNNLPVGMMSFQEARI
jgi:hypothetical protein